jgi:hypothetical protein
VANFKIKSQFDHEGDENNNGAKNAAFSNPYSDQVPFDTRNNSKFNFLNTAPLTTKLLNPALQSEGYRRQPKNSTLSP